MVASLHLYLNQFSTTLLKFKYYIPVLFFVATLYPAYAQKSLRLFKKGKYDQVEQLSLQELEEQKAEDGKGDFKSRTTRELIRRITPYYSLALINKTRGNFTKSMQNFKKADSVYWLFEIAMKKRMYNSKGAPKLLSIITGAERIEKNQARNHYNRQVEKVRIMMILGEMDEAKIQLDSLYAAMILKFGRETSLGKMIYSGYGEYFSLRSQYDSSARYFEKYIMELYNDPTYFDTSIKSLSDAYNGLSKSYSGMHDADKAVLAGQKSYKFANHRFVKATDGKNYLGKIAASNQLAESYRIKNNYEEALKWSNKSIALFNTKINVVSPEKLSLLATRGQIFWALSDTLNANQCFKELMEVFFSYTQNNFSYLSENEREYFYRTNKHYLDLTKGYYQYQYFQKGYQSQFYAKKLYEVNLNNKGVLLNSSAKLLNAVYASGDPLLIEQILTIRKLSETKSRHIQNGDIKEIEIVDKEMRAVEKLLRNQLSIPSEKYISMEEVMRAVPDSTDLIDVVKCKLYTIAKVPVMNRDSVMSLFASDESAYLYFIFNSKDELHLIQNEIGARELEGRFYKGYLNFARSNIKNQEIYDAYFMPIKKHLTSKSVIVSGDGVYNLLNPEILFDGKDYLIDVYNFFSLVTVKDLLKSQSQNSVLRDVTLIGWPDYTTHQNRYSKMPEDLPGTESEIDGIRKTIPVSIGQNTYTRMEANETKVKQIPSTSILHFATHGFFDASRIKDPMYTSGLVLAVSDFSKEDDDGYLTAYEASNLELKETFLVVLSACETGQGEFEDGEGVWGLQRAFQTAGVKYVVMSLFKVDDKITAELMQLFYSNIFNGDTVLSGFKKAEKFIKLKHDNPVEWGAFIVKGF